MKLSIFVLASLAAMSFAWPMDTNEGGNFFGKVKDYIDDAADNVLDKEDNDMEEENDKENINATHDKEKANGKDDGENVFDKAKGYLDDAVHKMFDNDDNEEEEDKKNKEGKKDLEGKKKPFHWPWGKPFPKWWPKKV